MADYDNPAWQSSVVREWWNRNVPVDAHGSAPEKSGVVGFNSRRPAHLTIPEIVPDLRRYLDKPENGAGGSLHIYTDDGNLDHGHIEYCLRRAMERGDADGANLAGRIMRLSRRQRRRLLVAIR